MKKMLCCIQPVLCTVKLDTFLFDLFSTNPGNGSEMTFVEGATKINLKKLTTWLFLGDLMQRTI